MKKCKKYPYMKKIMPIAVIFMIAFVAFSLIGFIDSVKAESSESSESSGSSGSSGPPPDGAECHLYCIWVDGSFQCYPCDDDDLAQAYLADDDDDTGNSPPVADDDSATVDEDSSNNQINVLSNDNDPDGDSLSIDSVGDPPHGISIDDGSFVYYTPDPGYVGSDSFGYIISDGNGGWDTATITMTVNSVNIEPNTPNQPSGPTTLKVGELGTFITSTTDPDGDDVDYNFRWGDGNNGGWVGPYNSGQIVSLSYSWSTAGTYNVDVRARDENGAISGWSNDLIVVVSNNNDPPSANDDLATVDEGETITQLDGGASSVLDNDNDPDSDPLTANLISGPSHASSFNLNSDGSFSYTHDGSKTISDSFTYEADDGNGGTDTATVDITINLVTDIPEKPTVEGGIQTCYTGISYNFESVLSDIGPNAKYYFYWDDGQEIPDPALWTPVAITPLTEAYDWSKAGVYDVKVGVVVDDLVNGGTITEWSLPFPVQVIHKSENPEDG